MQVSGLQVSLSIDMSGFVTAMEELIAMLEVTIDQLTSLATYLTKTAAALQALENSMKNMKGSTDDMNNSLDNTLGIVGDICDLAKDAIDIAEENPLGYVKGIVDIIKLCSDWKRAADDADKASKHASDSIKTLNDTIGDNQQGTPTGDKNSIQIKTPANNGITRDLVKSSDGSVTVADDNASSQMSMQDAVNIDYEKHLNDIKSKIDIQNAAITINGSLTAITAGEYDNFNKSLTQTTDNIGKQTGAIDGLTAAQKRAAAIAETLKQAMTTAFSDLGTILGNAMSGTKQNPFAMIAKQLGDAGKKFGEKLIAMGVASEWGLPGNPTGILEIAGGTALVAAGTAMSALKMAAGGLVSGSSIVNVGEYTGASHNPEVIAPLDKLHGMLGGQTQNHTFEIQGDKLVSILQRVDNNTSYALGGA